MPKFQFWLQTKLTRIQQRAVDSTKPIFLSGVPGTGKTVVPIIRLTMPHFLEKSKYLYLWKTIEKLKCLNIKYGQMLVNSVYESIREFIDVQNLSIRDGNIGKYNKFERVFKLLNIRQIDNDKWNLPF